MNTPVDPQWVTMRRKEIALRMALGAGTLLLAALAVLALAATAAGLPLARALAIDAARGLERS